MSINLAIDPNCLVLRPNHSRQETRKRLDFIMKWRGLEKEHSWIGLRIPRESPKILREQNLYPARSSIQESLTATNLDQIYSVNDIARQIDHLLSKPPVDEATKFTDVLWESFEWEPSLSVACKELEVSLQRMLLLILLSNSSNNSLVCASLMTSTIVITAAVTIGLPDAISHPVLPRRVTGTVECIADFESICDLIDPVSCWESAVSTMDIKRAIQLQCRKFMMGANSYDNWKSLPHFYIGDGFIDSLKEWQCWGSSTFAKQALTSIADAIVGNSEIRCFRESESSSVPRTRTSDGAIACRVHVTKKKEGLRLMLWELKDGIFELANMGPKKQLYIDTGNPANLT